MTIFLAAGQCKSTITDKIKQWLSDRKETMSSFCQAKQKHYIYYTLHPFNGLFSRTTWVSRHKKGKTSLDQDEARDDVVLRWQWHQLDLCKQSEPHIRRITTPKPHHLLIILSTEALHMENKPLLPKIYINQTILRHVIAKKLESYFQTTYKYSRL